MAYLRRFALFALLFVTLPASAADWPNTPENRWRATAEMESLSAELLADPRHEDFTLGSWCASHELGSGGIIHEITQGASAFSDGEPRETLDIDQGEEIAHIRSVSKCGEHIIREEDTWYLPSRLDAESRAAIAPGDRPFKDAIGTLKPHRVNISEDRKWRPDLVKENERVLTIPKDLFAHKSIIFRQDGLAIAEQYVVYKHDLMDIPLKPRRTFANN